MVSIFVVMIALGLCMSGIGNAAVVSEIEPNDTTASPQNIDNPINWTLDFDPNIGDTTTNTSMTIPHVTITGTGNDTFDVYSFTVSNAGNIGIFDIDFGITGIFTDSFLRLYDTDGTSLLTSNDDSPTSYGQGGSAGMLGGFHSFIEYTFTAPGTYFIEVGRFLGGIGPVPFPSGGDYQLQVSIENHANGSTATVPTMNEWGMIIFMVIAGFISVYYLYARRRDMKT